MIRNAVPDDSITAVPLILPAAGHIAFVLSGTSDEVPSAAYSAAQCAVS
jgi:hypothetical protein